MTVEPLAEQKVEIVKMGKLRPVLLSWLLALCCGAAVPVRAQNGFAVQVAAVQSRAEAEAMSSGLRVRGVNAYWVKADVPGKGTYYRVRIGGQFANNRSATEFGQKLRTAGLIYAYTVFKYDAPTSALDERAADRLATRAALKPPTIEPPTRKNVPVTGQADKTQERSPSTSAQPPRTDYLISGRPIPASELETTRSLGKPETAPPNPQTVKAQPGALNAITAIAKPGSAQAKRSDEIELDDFVEFTKVLRGTVEVQAGRLQVTLLNINKRHRFRGKVNLTFAENGREIQPAPMQLEIAPGQEHSFGVTPSVGRGGNYVLAVYDDQGALQLMQSGALDPPANSNLVAENRQPKSPPPAPTSQAGDVPPLQLLEGTEGEPPPASNDILKSPHNPTGRLEDDQGNERPQQQSEQSLPGDVKIIARKVSETSENLTLEFEILAHQPLGMITMALRTASTNEAKQAIMTTKQGRLPFLVPKGDTSGAFSYELKSEQGQLIAAGQMSFQQLKRD